ncbi:MAG TPA: hypothetical protein VM581_02080 [Magnetospirillaceae bacterium]|nr:hypothetical protein [Magnetospirillaceae bacterium]
MESGHETLPTPESTPDRREGGEFEINKGDIKEALQELTSMEGSSEVFGDMSSLGDIGGDETPKTTHLLAICAALWAKKAGDKGSASKFLTSFRRWASNHGQTGIQIAEMLLRRLYAAQRSDYDHHILSDADTLRDTIITTLGLTEHLGEADNERYEIALRAAVWAMVESGQMLPEPAEIRQVFRDTIHLWHRGVEEYQHQQQTTEETYKSILQDL